jgi:hypothetical protein
LLCPLPIQCREAIFWGSRGVGELESGTYNHGTLSRFTNQFMSCQTWGSICFSIYYQRLFVFVLFDTLRTTPTMFSPAKDPTMLSYPLRPHNECPQPCFWCSLEGSQWVVGEHRGGFVMVKHTMQRVIEYWTILSKKTQQNQT